MTDDLQRAQWLQTLKAHCQRPSTPVLFDEANGLLMDVFSTKTVPLRWDAATHLEQRQNKQTQNPYLLIVYEDGRQLAFSEVGLAFPPQFGNTGPLKDLPEVVCFRDYQSILDRLKHELYGHQDQEPTRQTVVLLMMCIAIIDGARAQGFEIGREEAELEHHLKELERRAPMPAAPV